jgi:hypothetical protein
MGPLVILVIVLVAVVTAFAAAAWGQFVDLRRKIAMMDLVKAAYAAGRDPPAAILEELARSGAREAPWSAVIAFSALAVGFWIAYARLDVADGKIAFLVVAATLTMTALGTFILALASGRRRRDSRGDGQ